MLITKAEENKNRIEKSQISLNAVHSDLSKITNEMLEMEKEIEDLEPKISKLQEIKTLEATLLKYLREKSFSLKTEIVKIKKTISEVKNSLSVLGNKDEVLITLQMVQSEKEELNKKANKLEGEIGKLNGFTECAKKIQIKDGKCPVCNSKITTINDMFDISHIKQELNKKQKEKALITSEILKLNMEELDFRKKEKNIISAEKTLSSYDVSVNQNIEFLEEKLVSLNKDFQIISNLNFNNFKGTANWLPYKVDEYSANLIDVTMKMKDDVVDVDINVLKQK